MGFVVGGRDEGCPDGGLVVGVEDVGLEVDFNVGAYVISSERFGVGVLDFGFEEVTVEGWVGGNVSVAETSDVEGALEGFLDDSLFDAI